MEVVGGRYELIRQVGAGGMGQVYEGFDRNLKRRVAVKLTHTGLDSDPEWTKRFLREAELMATVSHPGTPAIFDAGISEGAAARPFLVMEFVEGVTFESLLMRRGPLPIGVVASFGAQVAAVLAATHRHRIYHRDLKPSNLMLCDNGTVKVLDFGLAVALDSGLSRYTTTGQTIGTPAYMAPEQIESRDVTPQTDLYALGLILHELLTGDRVATGDNAYTVWSQRVSRAAPDIRVERPGTPADMAGLVMCMLEKKPESRPAGAGTVHTVLMRHTARRPRQRREQSRPYVRGRCRRPRRRPLRGDPPGRAASQCLSSSGTHWRCVSWRSPPSNRPGAPVGGRVPLPSCNQALENGCQRGDPGAGAAGCRCGGRSDRTGRVAIRLGGLGRGR